MNPHVDDRSRAPVRVLVMHEDEVIRNSYGNALRQRGCVVRCPWQCFENFQNIVSFASSFMK